jgi:hypothetical protein
MTPTGSSMGEITVRAMVSQKMRNPDPTRKDTTRSRLWS